ncbi:TPA: hypothetical protein ACGOWE_002111 [Streptococcus suis]|uniref:hypothetical protein n=1 Tax=Streptococcus parasuis TaxID=1501662 RepID=UPI002AA456A9|nr:hypothetical protein [Streptococcus suis]HEM3655844.1 hypothetical protein [Streptococcus suis]
MGLGVNSVEFHNELYGFIQAKAIDEDEQNYFENEFDKWLVTKGILQDKNYNRLNKNGSIISQPKTLPTLIRNVIHHPENQHNSYTIQELNQSTELLLDVLKNLI